MLIQFKVPVTRTPPQGTCHMRTVDDLRSDQQSCIDELYANDRAYVVMRMGGGKTATCLTAIAELIRDGHRRKGIVMAPPLVATTVWPAESKKWNHLSHLNVVALVGSPARRLATLQKSNADIFTVSDGVCKWLVDYLLSLEKDHPLRDIFVYDEPKLKNPRGVIGKNLKKLVRHVKTMWKFSGTPRPNGYEDLFLPAAILKPDLWGTNFDKWRWKNFMPIDRYGYRWEVHDFRVQQLDRDVKKFMFRATEPKDTREGTLTSGIEQDFEFDLPPAIQKQYRKMERDLIASLQKDDDEVTIAALSQAIASSKLSQIVQGFLYDEEKVAHEIHSLKTDILNYQLDAIGSEAVAICYGFHADADRIENLLKAQGRRYGKLGHGVSLHQKIKHIEQWNEGKLDNLLLHPAAAGHGVEAQFGGRRVIWYCPTWSPEQYDQTIKRFDRPGQRSQVFSHQIIARKTVDVVKRARVEFKISSQASFKSLLDTL